MSRQRAPRTVALCDRTLAALEEGPATAQELAERIGRLPCSCLGTDHPGCYAYDAAKTCTACLGWDGKGIAGWRPAYRGDMQPVLMMLNRDGLAGRIKIDGRVLWQLASDYAPIAIARDG